MTTKGCPKSAHTVESSLTSVAIPPAVVGEALTGAESPIAKDSPHEGLHSLVIPPVNTLKELLASKALERPPFKIVDVKAFLASIDNRPVFTRGMLQHAADQLQNACDGKSFEVVDCYGTTHPGRSKIGETPEICYNFLDLLADPDPYRAVRHLTDDDQAEVVSSRKYDSVNDMVGYAKFPVYVRFLDRSKEREYSEDEMYYRYHQSFVKSLRLWNHSSHSVALLETIDKIKAMARITNIVCIGLGSFARSERSIMQHVVASFLAEKLTTAYGEAAGTKEQPITIVAQDPAYHVGEKTMLSSLPVPIRTVPDPEAFLAINDSSLVMSHAPSVPVKCIVADLAAADKGPAALFWCRHPNDELFPDVDDVVVPVIPSLGEVYYADLKTRRVFDMLKGYEKLMHAVHVPGLHWRGPDMFAEEGNGAHFNWLKNMEMWARPEA